jgi:hypothetical protein
MRRLGIGLVAGVAAAALAGCGSGSEERTPAAGGDGTLASLVVTVDDDGARGSEAPRELRLDCARPTDSAACGAAAGVSAADVAETPAGTACAQLYGGPEEATIKGTIRGADVDAAFKRTDGCQTARWERVQALLDEVR